MTRTIYFALLAILLLPATRASAQDEVPRITRTYAITGATVIPAPGEQIDNGTVVLRDGKIVAVGANVSVPADAVVIDGDSMYVYAGFIDGLSHVGIPEPKRENPPSADDPGDPGYERAGIQPHQSAASLVDPESNTISGHREAGFAVVNVAPYGRMLPGRTSVTSLGVDGPTFLRRDGAMFAQFTGAQGVYPRTPVAVMAHFRQLFRESARQQSWEEAYATSPAGKEHPPGDEVMQAFYPVHDGQQPVLFNASTVLEAQRAARLQADLGFDLILGGVTQAAEMVPFLAEAGYPVILSVALPKEDKADKSAKKDADSTAADMPSTTAYNAGFITRGERDLDEERKNLEARRAETRQRYIEAGAALEKAGVAFGFATIDVKSGDVHKNIRKMVDAGLSPDAALAALTVNNARMLGIDKSTGSVRQGMLANLVVTTGALFEEDSKIKYVFVNGAPTKIETAQKKSGGRNGGGDGADPDVSAFVGSWRFLVDTPDGEVTGRFELMLEDGRLIGTVSAPGYGTSDIDDALVDGNDLSLSFTNAQVGKIDVSVVRSGTRWSGSMNVPGSGDLPLTARQSDGPGNTRNHQ